MPLAVTVEFATFKMHWLFASDVAVAESGPVGIPLSLSRKNSYTPPAFFCT